MGIYFQIKGRKSFKATLFRSILNYIRWQKGELLSLSEVKDILEYSPLLVLGETRTRRKTL